MCRFIYIQEIMKQSVTTIADCFFKLQPINLNIMKDKINTKIPILKK